MTSNFLTDLTMGGDIAVGANNITMTGNLASGVNPITHGWFTDLTVANAIAGNITGNAATVTTNANLTGPITSSGNATSVASQTGTGTKFVMDTSPALVTPNIGAATGTSLNLSGLTASSALATDGSKNLVSVTNTGSGNNVLATSPTITTPGITQVNAPTTTGVGVAGRTDGGSVAAGNIGEVLSNTIVSNPGTATMTIAAPCVVTFSGHGLQTGAALYFTTTGTLPTGLAVNTNYYAIKIDANTFNLSTTVANAFAGTKITTTGSQSGTHTCNQGTFLSSVVFADGVGLQLTPGIWSLTHSGWFNGSGGAAISGMVLAVSLTSSTSAGTVPGLYYDNGFVLVADRGAFRTTGPRIISVSTTTTIFGTVRTAFSSGSVTNQSILQAIRIG